MRAEIISVGTELTTGQTVDTNSAWLSRELAAIGVDVVGHRTAPDDAAILRRAIEQAADSADCVVITGGIGPTEDDLTRQAMAEALHVPLELHEPSLEHVRAFFARRRRTMPERNRVQAMFPAGSRVIENRWGTAPGIHARLHGADMFVLPGVPSEMRAMFQSDLVPRLTAAAGGRCIRTRCVWTYGVGESDVATMLGELMDRSRNPLVGTTAQETAIGVRIVSAGASPDEAHRLLEATEVDVRQRLGDLVFGRDDNTLAGAVAEWLIRRGLTVATAESCTGGLLAKSLTDIPGSSAYFRQGYVTYADEAKTRLLGVSAETLAQHGAVSAEVAEQMAVECRRRAETDYALAVTGIAGPTGGSDEKPVGLVYIALAAGGDCTVRELHFGHHLTRKQIRDRSRKQALNMLRTALLPPTD